MILLVMKLVALEARRSYFFAAECVLYHEDMSKEFNSATVLL